MITIRKAELSDIDSIFWIFETAIRGLAKEHYTPEQIEAWIAGLTPQKLAATITYYNTFVAELDGKPAGFVIIDLANGEIKALYVAADYVRLGVGTRLFEHIEQHARKHGLKSLHLRASLNAYPFYKKHGYMEVERIAYQMSNEIALDCINMKKQLD